MRGGPKFTQLPDHFVDSLKVLFDVVDTERKGFVTYEEICARWRHLPTAQLPSNFLDCLGRLTPPSGKLTFERFLAGIRLALTEKRQGTSNLQRVRSEGKLDMDDLGMERKRGPTMGLNGFDRRSALYASQPEVYSTNVAAADNYQVIMRPKKVLPPSYNNIMDHRNSNLIRIPQPPLGTDKEPQTVKIPLQPQNGNRFRPVSSNSFGSVSSGMAEIQWRNSQMSTSPSTISGESQHSSNGKQAYSDDQQPKVVMPLTGVDGKPGVFNISLMSGPFCNTAL
ncbi:hypothetical protein QR680_015583 [Steinernema hermaphroditum]|uniref:EF-hand domain-containing protein n=1 Tax=Steinernema hermaphroditum TaxID=289476 RepID=A0AA39H8A3_9BILA|nr:hypothetical protein QR680_015583 [Steinernema hermaphroditum]